jgi:hypothetical protein
MFMPWEAKKQNMRFGKPRLFFIASPGMKILCENTQTGVGGWMDIHPQNAMDGNPSPSRLSTVLC